MRSSIRVMTVIRSSMGSASIQWAAAGNDFTAAGAPAGAGGGPRGGGRRPRGAVSRELVTMLTDQVPSSAGRVSAETLPYSCTSGPSTTGRPSPERKWRGGEDEATDPHPPRHGGPPPAPLSYARP